MPTQPSDQDDQDDQDEREVSPQTLFCFGRVLKRAKGGWSSLRNKPPRQIRLRGSPVPLGGSICKSGVFLPSRATEIYRIYIHISIAPPWLARTPLHIAFSRLLLPSSHCTFRSIVIHPQLCLSFSFFPDLILPRARWGQGAFFFSGLEHLSVPKVVTQRNLWPVMADGMTICSLINNPRSL